MFSELAFFSFVHLTDQTQHGAYNRWHQLDHRPENLALPGVAWGDRWARTAECQSHSQAEGVLQGVDYVAMYWFRSPIDEAVDAWDRLGEQSFQWGRGPLIPGIERKMLAFFRPVKGYAAPRALVAPEILPFRPNRGLHVRVTEFDEPHSMETHRSFTHEDQEAIPALLDIDGVAGAWTFSYSHAQRHSSLPFDTADSRGIGGVRIRLLYLEDDPVALTSAINQVQSDYDSGSIGREILSSPLRTIVPWQDW